MNMFKQLFLIAMALLVASAAGAQTVETIVGNYIAFTGGRDAWKNVKTMITSGEYNYGGMPFPFTTYAKAPDHYKLIVPFNGKYYAQGFDGSKGWKIDAFKNETTPTWMTGKDARAMANEADVVLENVFIDYTSKGHQVSLIGKDTAMGKPCYVIELVRADHERERYYFDESTYALLMKAAPSKNAELKAAPLKIFYSDYRVLQGIKMPFKTVCESEGQTILVITVAEASINKPVNDKEFQP